MTNSNSNQCIVIIISKRCVGQPYFGIVSAMGSFGCTVILRGEFDSSAFLVVRLADDASWST